jgi:pimeloyl-ACP methyl ester carboxylesterase
MADGDAGLAHHNWKGFYTPKEVEEIESAATTTMFISGRYPIHARMYLREPTSPTVVMAHPMLPYGIMLARLQLPFYRAGFNVIQWDLPGWGQSGGPRGAVPVTDFILAWHDALAFALTRVHGPMYAMGLAEDSVTCYYIGANNARLNAISLHTLHEYGDPDGVRWQGSPLIVRLKAAGVNVGKVLRPSLAIDAHQALPWESIFSHESDGPLLERFENDPLRVRRFEFPLGASMLQRVPPPVPMEQCMTPVQVIASEKSRLWPYEMNVRYYERLGGPKELVTLYGKDQWEYTLEFHEEYAAHVIRWFTQHGAFAGDGATARVAG